MDKQIKPGDRRAFYGTMVSTHPSGYAFVKLDGSRDEKFHSVESMQASKPLRKKKKVDLGPLFKAYDEFKKHNYYSPEYERVARKFRHELEKLRKEHGK